MRLWSFCFYFFVSFQNKPDARRGAQTRKPEITRCTFHPRNQPQPPGFCRFHLQVASPSLGAHNLPVYTAARAPRAGSAGSPTSGAMSTRPLPIRKGVLERLSQHPCTHVPSWCVPGLSSLSGSAVSLQGSVWDPTAPGGTNGHAAGVQGAGLGCAPNPTGTIPGGAPGPHAAAGRARRVWNAGGPGIV